MKNLILFLFAVSIAACTNAPTTVQQNSDSPETPRSERPQTMAAHTTENQPGPVPNTAATPGASKWSAGGSPIDTSKLDQAISDAQKALRSKPNDAAAKKALAEAYYERGLALTDARQYASALGDYRRAVKNDPDHADAKKWIEQIITIYGQMNKAYPKEGEEPPPLPYKQPDVAASRS